MAKKDAHQTTIAEKIGIPKSERNALAKAFKY